MVRKYVDSLMFCSEGSNGSFRYQNNIVYKFQSVQFSAAFKYEHGGKWIHIPLVFLKVIFCKVSSRVLEIKGILKFVCLFLCERSRAFAYTVGTWARFKMQFLKLSYIRVFGECFCIITLSPFTYLTLYL